MDSKAMEGSVGGAESGGGGVVCVGHSGEEREERLTAGTRLSVKQGCGADQSVKQRRGKGALHRAAFGQVGPRVRVGRGRGRRESGPREKEGGRSGLSRDPGQKREEQVVAEPPKL